MPSRPSIQRADRHKSPHCPEFYWDQVRDRFKNRSSDNETIHSLARKCGLHWFASRGNDRVADFVKLSWRELNRLPWFGKKKAQRLLCILSASACFELPAALLKDEAPPKNFNPFYHLNELQIPEAFPVSFVRFSHRVKEFCRRSEIDNIGQLFRFFNNEGNSGLLVQRNLGKKTAGEINRFYDVAASGDENGLAEFLPYCVGEKGLFFSQGAFHLLKSFSRNKKRALFGRLVKGYTLERSAQTLGVTRERIRQIEECFIGSIEDLLGWFEEDRNRLFAYCQEEKPLAEAFQRIPDEADRAMVAVAVHRIFRKSNTGSPFRRRP